MTVAIDGLVEAYLALAGPGVPEQYATQNDLIMPMDFFFATAGTVGIVAELDHNAIACGMLIMAKAMEDA